MVSLRDKEINHTHMIDTKIFYSKDVKQAVLSFEDKIKDLSHTPDMEEKWLRWFREDFGDFNK